MSIPASRKPSWALPGCPGPPTHSHCCKHASGWLEGLHGCTHPRRVTCHPRPSTGPPWTSECTSSLWWAVALALHPHHCAKPGLRCGPTLSSWGPEDYVPRICCSPSGKGSCGASVAAPWLSPRHEGPTLTIGDSASCDWALARQRGPSVCPRLGLGTGGSVPRAVRALALPHMSPYAPAICAGRQGPPCSPYSQLGGG